MHSSRIRIARSLTVSRRIPTHAPPPDSHAPCNHAHPHATMHTPRNHAHLPQPCTPPPPPVNRTTYRCKNITLPQTSFEGGKKWVHNPFLSIMVNHNRVINRRCEWTIILSRPYYVNLSLFVTFERNFSIKLKQSKLLWSDLPLSTTVSILSTSFVKLHNFNGRLRKRFQLIHYTLRHFTDQENMVQEAN